MQLMLLRVINLSAVYNLFLRNWEKSRAMEEKIDLGVSVNCCGEGTVKIKETKQDKMM